MPSVKITWSCQASRLNGIRKEPGKRISAVDAGPSPVLCMPEQSFHTKVADLD